MAGRRKIRFVTANSESDAGLGHPREVGGLPSQWNRTPAAIQREMRQLRILVLPTGALLACCGGGPREQPIATGQTGASSAGTTAQAESSGPASGGGVLDVADEPGTSDSGDTPGPSILTCAEAEDAQSNQGCEFWAVDLPQAWGASATGGLVPEDLIFAVVVANTHPQEAAQVRVFSGAENEALESASVEPGGTHEFRLPSQNVPPRENSAGVPAFRVESDLPITAYQFNPIGNVLTAFSTDASVLFPTHVLGSDYIAVTSDSVLLLAENGNGLMVPDNAGAFISVVATQDGTFVDLVPAWPDLYPGSTSGVALDRGEVFTAISVGVDLDVEGWPDAPTEPGAGNLSGSRVIANKPIAVFSGNVSAIEPAPSPDCCADHIEHQMLPLVAWGSTYAAALAPAGAAPGASDPTAFRIVGAFDDTALSYDPSPPPGAPTVVNAGEAVRFRATAPFVVTGDDPDKPFALVEFLLSNQAIDEDGQPGDPAMIALPPVEQFQHTYIFLVPNGFESNYVTVILPAGTDVEIDGAPLEAGAVRPLGMLDERAFEFAHVPLTSGSHALEATEPVGIVSVGYASDVSYGYPGGAGLSSITVPPPVP